MSDDEYRDIAKKLKDRDAARSRLQSAEMALEECKRFILEFAAHLGSHPDWRNIRFTNHVAPLPANVVQGDETFSIERWPNREKIQRLLEDRQLAAVALQGALTELPESLRELPSQASPQGSMSRNAARRTSRSRPRSGQ
jgi:hypothetical protein